MHGRGQACTYTPQQILRDTVNEWAVRILLECILVKIFYYALALQCNLASAHQHIYLLKSTAILAKANLRGLLGLSVKTGTF